MRCPDEVIVLAAIEGRLSAAERIELDVHLDTCPTCLQLLGHLAAGTLPAASAEVPSPVTTERYELGVEIGRGGMGRVYLAHDRKLGREVAIKRVADPTGPIAHRFAREIALTARLEHPAIVPIHDAGTFPDGSAYYAMRLVGGATLARLVERAADLRARLALLPHVVTIAHAVAYAHSRGVVHRDLKPHNIVVGEFGETMLLDWGLAKTTDDAPDEPVAANTTRDQRDGDTQQATTAHGQIVGTPGFMAPEQAQGRAVDLASDIYGLGATLYFVVTGQRPPRVLGDELARAEVPQDLVAIIVRAMQSTPKARYPTATALASDLSRFLTGQLVESRRYTLGERMRRWARKHRALVTVSSAALFAVAMLAVISVRRVLHERGVAETARQAAERQRDAAENMVAFLATDLLTQLDRIGRLDLFRGAGEQIEAYYSGVAATGDEPLTMRAHRAKARIMLGEAALGGGTPREAEPHLRAALHEAKQLETAGDERGAILRCEAELDLAATFNNTERADEGIAFLQACATTARAQLDAHPGDPRWLPLHGQASLQLMMLARKRGDTKEAKARAREAQEVGRALLARGTTGAAAVIAAEGSLRLAQMAITDRDWPTAVGAAQATLDDAQRAVALDPDAVDAQHAVAVAWDVVGTVRLEKKDLAGAREAYTAMRAQASQLVTREPRNVVWQRSLGLAEDRLATLAVEAGDIHTALVHYKAGRDVSAALLKVDPDSLEYLQDLSISDFTLAQLYEGLNDAKAARTAYELGVASIRAALAKTPNNLQLERALATQLSSITQFAIDEKDFEWAREAGEEGLKRARRVLSSEEAPHNRLIVGNLLYHLARLDAGAKRRARLEEAAEVVATLRPLVTDDEYIASLIHELDRTLRLTSPAR
ncbi:MAG: protein kinase [Kofleriaceae bacterium]|nr:protein kinase [Kofleriaceae bacterium]